MSNSHTASVPALLGAAAVLFPVISLSTPAAAQTAGGQLPAIVVTADRPEPSGSPPLVADVPAGAGAESADPTAIPSGAAGTPPGGSLTIPAFPQAQREVERAPGAVQVVPAEAYRNTTPAATIKDALDYVAGVFVQPKWGEDSRLSIRGSGLSRNFHLRGIQLYMDGIPINTADGYGDFQEIDPSAYRYIEVYKGANALRFGANSLGGAINFVMPSGRDASPLQGSLDVGGYGFFRMQASSGGVHGPLDYFVTGSWQRQEGFREHSSGESQRGSANIGYQITPDIETRFYFNLNHIRQRIPGSVTKEVALTAPRTAATNNVVFDWQRNVDSGRFANKTTIRLGDTTVEVGAFVASRHLLHPIYQWLDYRYADFGGFARAIDDRIVGGYRNRLVAGVTVHNGWNNAEQYQNLPGGVKGALLSRTRDTSANLAAYAENAFYVLPSLALVAGTQFLHATRDRKVFVAQPGVVPGSTEFNLWSPKFGALWQVDPTWQVFANISRSAEVPSFGEGSSFPNPVIPFFDIKPQRATTYEFGTRGRRPDYVWDLALYRAEIRDELQCLYSAFGNCNVVNAKRTVHQGIEAAAGAVLWKGLWAKGPDPDRLWLNIAYTYNDFYFDRDPVFGYNRLPGAPPHILRGELLYKHPTGFYFGPNVEWGPESYYVDSANTVTTEPYAIWGLKAGWEGEKVSVYFEARNLANTAYIASTSITDRATLASPLFEPGTGRTFFAGIRGRI